MGTSTIGQNEHIKIMQSVMTEIKNLPLILKGGTSLLLCYGLDRFSEDLDLDGIKKLNLVNKLKPVFNRLTLKYEIRIPKDTDTTQRINIYYETAISKGKLKIETSYRDGFIEDDIAVINGIKTYKINKLIEQKVSALENRTTARDLYDVTFLVSNYPKHFSDLTKQNLLRIAGDIETLESRFRIVFENDDIFAENVLFDDIILKLHDSLKLLD
jgi:predicted nucleotidyltransferase component of viral defense system